MGQTKDFFKEKKDWSRFKDKILDCYLTPYIAKIVWTGKPLVIFDCFAGKGKFDNGENGSPLIIAEHIKSTLQKDVSLSNKVKGVFIEKKYYNDLESSLAGYSNTEVLEGTFEENLRNILSVDTRSNIFLYVDPYGIKSLSLDNFKQIKDKNFSSLEMLMNFNSAAFLREGCRLLKLAKLEGLFKDDELADYETDDGINNIARMDAIAGGAYWQDILNDFYKGIIKNIHQAEDKFISEYSLKLKDIYNYRVNIPIKLKSSHLLPKYRLIFGSNHEDGLILMADNMHKILKEIIANQRGNQPALFDFPESKGFDLREGILSFVPANNSGILLKSMIVKLIQKYGITFSESDYKKEISSMEQNSALIIDRVPPLTPTGKPAISMEYGKGKGKYKIIVRKKL